MTVADWCLKHNVSIDWRYRGLLRERLAMEQRRRFKPMLHIVKFPPEPGDAALPDEPLVESYGAVSTTATVAALTWPPKPEPLLSDREQLKRYFLQDSPNRLSSTAAHPLITVKQLMATPRPITAPIDMIASIHGDVIGLGV